MRAGKWLIGCSVAAVLAGAGAAQAGVAISNKATANMSCTGGVCTATARKAVLNAGDLATMLASGDVTVKTGSISDDIDIEQPLSWTSTSRLTLDAQRTVEFEKPVTVAGTGAVTIAYNDGGSDGDLLFQKKGSLTFWDLSSSLIINGPSYTLVGDIPTLASDIAANPSGLYALAKSYDASADGPYTSSPISTTFGGTFDGLGNQIRHLTIKFPARHDGVIIGLFSTIGLTGRVGNLGMAAADLEGTSGIGEYGAIGPLAGSNEGSIDHVWTSGSAKLPGGSGAQIGGLVGENDGTISNCSASQKVHAKSGVSNVASLAGANFGSIVRSYADGTVQGDRNDATENVGGLVGRNAGELTDTFTLAAVRQQRGCCDSTGGLVGTNEAAGRVATSYAAGEMTLSGSLQGYAGGLVGTDLSSAGALSSTYWDLEKGVSSPDQGAGNIKDDPGISGLTTEQFQSGLPKGFDPKVWAQDPNVNSGFPYLRALFRK